MDSRFFIRILLLLLAALPILPADAADLMEMSLESLMNVTVKGASRYEQKSSEAPTNASIVTASDIRKYGYRTLADVLRSLPGIFTTNDRNYTYLGIRGFQPPGDFNTRLLLLVDGHRINNAIYDHAMIGEEFPVDIDLIERVEVVRGPSSSLYGSNAFFGVINVITKRAYDLDGAELSGSAGSWRTFKGRATAGKDFLMKETEILLSGTVSRSHGQDLYFPEFDDPATNNGMAEDADGERLHQLFGKFAWHDFTLEGVHGYRRKTIPTASYSTVFNDPGTYTGERLSYMDLNYDKGLSDNSSLLARVYYDYYYYWGDYILDYAGAPFVSNKDYAKSQSLGAELKTTARLGERHRVTLGGEYRDDFRKDQRNFDVDGVYTDSEQSSKQWALYLQDEFRIHPKLILNAGVRYDHYSNFGGTTNPRVGLIWMPREKTVAKLLYGRAFRIPNAYELYYGDHLTMAPNPDLEPETIYSYEAILEQYFEGLGGSWKASVSTFHYRINDLITSRLDEQGAAVFGNNDSIETNGIELELGGKLSNGIEGRASYAWQRAEYASTKETPPTRRSTW